MNTPLVALLLAALFALPSSAEAFCHLRTKDPAQDELCATEGIELAWFARCSTVKLLPRTKPGLSQQQIREVIQRSFDTWNEVTCGPDDTIVGLETTVSDANATQTKPDHRRTGGNENVVMFVDSAAVWAERMNPSSALGLTSVFHDKGTGQILGADIEINDWRTGKTIGICGSSCPASIQTDLENVLTHEAGHYYGLGHVGDTHPEATMYFQAPDREVIKRDIAPDDIAGLCDTYPPGVFGESCTVSARTPSSDGCGCTTVGTPASSAIGWSLLLTGALAFGLRRRREH